MGYMNRQVKNILSEFESVVAGDPSPEIGLTAHDILEFRGILELLDICRRYNKRISIRSPGLRLADADFARQLSEYNPHFTMTYLSDDPDIYHRMTGNPDALDLVRKAINNLRNLKINFSVNCVATKYNYMDLMNVAAFLFGEIGLDCFALVFFIPERRHVELDPDIADLFVPYSKLNIELKKFAREYAGSGNSLSLCHVPPCKLDHEILDCRNIKCYTFSFCDPDILKYKHQNCEMCKFNDSCAFVFQIYQEKYPDEDFPFERVNRAIHNLKA